MYYTPNAIDEILEQSCPRCVKKDGNLILNEAISFDIETTSTYYNGDKVSFMYVWMFDIFDKTIIGRTWVDFVNTMNRITYYFSLSDIKRRIIVYVHNLAYEFQFIRKWFKWYKVFSLSRRKPLYAVTTSGIEFRCSYRLSGYKLEKIGEQLGIEKLPDFDYSKIRHSKTVLSKRELEYCIHDVKIVSAYIRQKIKEEDDDISQIPLTKTGYVRRYVRNITLRGANRCFYKQAISSLTLEPEEYLLAKRAFAGGFTHAGFLHAGIERKNVTSFDFGSSYPTVLIAEKYPMTKGEKIEEMSKEQFYNYMDNEECCVFTIYLTDVEQIFPCESYISSSRCRYIEGAVINNGRVYSAKKIKIDITSVDFNIIRKVYKFNLHKFENFYHYEKYYLPTSFIKCILHFYNIKTQLKGVVGKETEYMSGKENLNSLFGMCVTDIVRELIIYNDAEGWRPPEDLSDDEYMDFVSNQLDKENNKKSRFLFYLWGVFCTAYARKNLWSGIFECKSDYIYSDTDSVKILNYEKHKEYFEQYNKEITAKLETALDYHKLSHDLIRPKNKKGEEKPLGIWELDGFYYRFKAIRAKSYMYYSTEKNEADEEYTDFHMTIAGLYKRDRGKPITKDTKLDAIDYLKTIGDPIKLFETGMHIPPEYTGKLTHTYIDDAINIPVEDYQHNLMVVYERSSVHLESTDFHMTIAKAYAEFLDGVHTNKYK